MGAKKPQPDLEVFFESPDVYPEMIPVRALADTLSALHPVGRRSEGADEDKMEGVSLRLLDVKRGSAVFRCVADQPEDLIRGLRLAGQWLEKPDGRDELGYALNPLRRLSMEVEATCSKALSFVTEEYTPERIKNKKLWLD